MAVPTCAMTVFNAAGKVGNRLSVVGRGPRFLRKISAKRNYISPSCARDLVVLNGISAATRKTVKRCTTIGVKREQFCRVAPRRKGNTLSKSSYSSVTAECVARAVREICPNQEDENTLLTIRCSLRPPRVRLDNSADRHRFRITGPTRAKQFKVAQWFDPRKRLFFPRPSRMNLVYLDANRIP